MVVFLIKITSDQDNIKYRLETQVNNWLRENPDVRITDRQFQLALSDSQLGGYAAITIFYLETADHPVERDDHHSIQDRKSAHPPAESDARVIESWRAAERLVRPPAEPKKLPPAFGDSPSGIDDPPPSRQLR